MNLYTLLQVKRFKPYFLPRITVFISSSQLIYMKNTLEKFLTFVPEIIGIICVYFFIIDSSFVITPIKIIGGLLVVVGVVFLIYSYHYLGESYSRKLTPKSVLKTKGPYGFVRHPITLGWMIVFLGAEIFSQSIKAITFMVLLYLLLIIRAKVEEVYLEKKFGKKWRRYRERVGFLFPTL